MPAILIGFRAEGWDLLEDFLQTAAALDVDKSKLARLAISYGLDEARRTLSEEQRVQAAREVRVMYLMKAQRLARIDHQRMMATPLAPSPPRPLAFLPPCPPAP